MRGVVSYPRYVCTKTGRPVADVLQEKHSNMRVTPMENPTCAAFEEYEELPELVLHDFSENNITWVASKLSGAAGALVIGSFALNVYRRSLELSSTICLTVWLTPPPPRMLTVL